MTSKGRPTSFEFDGLSVRQQQALADLVYRGGLLHARAGWEGTEIHTSGTIAALERRGYCTVTPGTLEATKNGRAILRLWLRHNSVAGSALAGMNVPGRPPR